MKHLQLAFSKMAAPEGEAAFSFTHRAATDVSSAFGKLAQSFGKIARTKTKDDEESRHSAIGAALGAIAAQMSGAGIVGTALWSMLAAGLAAEFGPKAKQFVSEAMGGDVSPQTTVAAAHELAQTHPNQLTQAGDVHPVVRQLHETGVSIPVTAPAPRQIAGPVAGTAAQPKPAEVDEKQDAYRKVLDRSLSQGVLTADEHARLTQHTTHEDLTAPAKGFLSATEAGRRLGAMPGGAGAERDRISRFLKQVGQFYDDQGAEKQQPQGRTGSKDTGWQGKKEKFLNEYGDILDQLGGAPASAQLSQLKELVKRTEEGSLKRRDLILQRGQLDDSLKNELMGIADFRASQKTQVDPAAADQGAGDKFLSWLRKPKPFDESSRDYAGRLEDHAGRGDDVTAIRPVVAALQAYEADKTPETSRAYMTAVRNAVAAGVPEAMLPWAHPAHAGTVSNDREQVEEQARQEGHSATGSMSVSDPAVRVSPEARIRPEDIVEAMRATASTPETTVPDAVRRIQRQRIVEMGGPRTAGDLAALHGKQFISSSAATLERLNKIAPDKRTPEEADYANLHEAAKDPVLAEQLKDQLASATTALHDHYVDTHLSRDDDHAKQLKDELAVVRSGGLPGAGLLELLKGKDNDTKDRVSALIGNPVIHPTFSRKQIAAAAANTKAEFPADVVEKAFADYHAAFTPTTGPAGEAREARIQRERAVASSQAKLDVSNRRADVAGAPAGTQAQVYAHGAGGAAARRFMSDVTGGLPESLRVAPALRPTLEATQQAALQIAKDNVRHQAMGGTAGRVIAGTGALTGLAGAAVGAPGAAAGPAVGSAIAGAVPGIAAAAKAVPVIGPALKFLAGTVGPAVSAAAPWLVPAAAGAGLAYGGYRAAKAIVKRLRGGEPAADPAETARRQRMGLPPQGSQEEEIKAKQDALQRRFDAGQGHTIPEVAHSTRAWGERVQTSQLRSPVRSALRGALGLGALGALGAGAATMLAPVALPAAAAVAAGGALIGGARGLISAYKGRKGPRPLMGEEAEAVRQAGGKVQAPAAPTPVSKKPTVAVPAQSAETPEQAQASAVMRSTKTPEQAVPVIPTATPETAAADIRQRISASIPEHHKAWGELDPMDRATALGRRHARHAGVEDFSKVPAPAQAAFAKGLGRVVGKRGVVSPSSFTPAAPAAPAAPSPKPKLASAAPLRTDLFIGAFMRGLFLSAA